MKSIGPEEFYREVALSAGISDIETVKRVYFGLVRVMSRQLKARQIIRLPDWGEFFLKIHKSRRFKSIDGMMGVLPPKPTIKWKSCLAVKQYFHEFGGEK
jgi:hypothetical protein